MKILVRIKPIGLGAFDHAVNGGTGRSAFGTAAEEPVLAFMCLST